MIALEKLFWGPEKIRKFFVIKRVGTLHLGTSPNMW